MKNEVRRIWVFLLMPYLLLLSARAEDITYIGDKGYLSLVPAINAIEKQHGRGKIAFAIKNEYSEDIAFDVIYPRIDLATLDESGALIGIEDYAAGGRGLRTKKFGGPHQDQIVLKPGDSTTLYARYSQEDMDAVVRDSKPLVGMIEATIVSSNQMFRSISQQFPSSSEMGKGWVDLGENAFLAIAPDPDKAVVHGGTFQYSLPVFKAGYNDLIKTGWAETIDVPVNIANASGQNLLVNSRCVRSFIVREGSGRISPPPWELLESSGTMIQVGSQVGGLNASIFLRDLVKDGYRPGDKIVVSIGGRIPDTNRIFVCYSAPFELPSLPSGPPKSELDLFFENRASIPVPEVPSGLTGRCEGATIKLTWNSSNGASSYSIYRGLAAGQESEDPIFEGYSSTIYTDKKVAKGTNYFYKVRAHNIANSSNYSDEVSVMAGLPSVPGGLVANPGDTQVRLQWSPAEGADSYCVYRGTSPGGEDRDNPVASSLTVPSFTDGGLANGTTYYYTVKAVNQYGASDFSQEVSCMPLQAPTPPANLTATGTIAQIQLTWTASDRATSYNIFRGLTPGGEDLATPIASSTTNSFSDSSFQNTGGSGSEVAYYYKVNALNGTVPSQLSNEAHATPLKPVPTNLGIKAGNTSLTLTWMGVSGAIRYNVYRGTYAGGEDPNPVDSVSTTGFTDSGLTNWLKYYYKVRAVFPGEVTGAASGEANGVPVPPGPRLSVSWEYSSNNSLKRAHLRWTGVFPEKTFFKVDGTITSEYTYTGTWMDAKSATYYYVVYAITPQGTLESNIIRAGDI
jgi:fibronectin type 3 domain-containing protein